MNSNEIYRVAFETANAELKEITSEFERLSARKDRIEKLVIALKSFVVVEETQAATSVVVVSQPATRQSEAAAEPQDEPKREPEPIAADPFQRRIDHVLGIGAGIRDVRKYTRQF